MFTRTMLRQGAFERPSANGDGLSANFDITSFAAETDETITIPELSGGLLQQGVTLTSDVVYTLPTAVLILAAAADMNVGDSLSFVVTNAQAGAFDVILAVGVGITAIGANNALTCAPQSSRVFTLVKTAAATMDLY